VISLVNALNPALLGRITGGVADAGRCFDAVWPWAAAGAATGRLWTGGLGIAAGAAIGGVGAYLSSAECGNGTDTPATQMRQGVTNFVNRLRGR
jgi:hypothetical protein